MSRRRLSRKERERRRRLTQAALIAVVIIIAIAIVFLVKGCADRKKSAGKTNNSSVVNETTQQGINMTETDNKSTTSTVKDKTESVSEQNENNASGSNDNSAAGGGSGFENIGKTSKGFNIQVKNGATYIDGYLIANKTYALPSTFVPENPETPVTEARSNKSLDKDLMAAFRKMQADATADGLNIYIASGYRSYDYQVSLYNRYVAKDGKAAADTYSSRPGNSEHQTGLCFDLNSIEDSFQYTSEGKWVNNNCYKYGFCIRFPKGKDAYTGYQYESWHLRYVGTELAEKLYNDGNWISLEEYFGITSEYPD